MENFASRFRDLEDPRPGNAGRHDPLKILRAPHDGPCRQIGRHQLSGIVRHTAEGGKGSVMAIAEGFAGLRRIALDETDIAVGQIHRKEIHLALDPGDDCRGLPEVDLGVAGVVGQRNKDLATPPTAFPDLSGVPSLHEL